MVSKRNTLRLGIKCGLILDSFIQLDRHFARVSGDLVQSQPSSPAHGKLRKDATGVVLVQPFAVGGVKGQTQAKKAQAKASDGEGESDMQEFWGEIYGTEIDLGQSVKLTDEERRQSHCR